MVYIILKVGRTSDQNRKIAVFFTFIVGIELFQSQLIPIHYVKWEFNLIMTVNSPFALKPIIRTEQTRKPKPASSTPIANRNFKAVGFIAENMQSGETDDTLIIAHSWMKSPERTIIALGQAGYTGKEIAGKVGLKADSKEWMDVFRSAQNLFKRELAEDSIVGEIPDSVIQQVQDADGEIHEVDIADKLKKAVTAALFGKDQTVKVTAMRGATLESTLSAVFNKSVDSINTTRNVLKRKYGEAFRTRDTSGGPVVIPLPAALRAALDKEAVAAEAATAPAPAAE